MFTSINDCLYAARVFCPLCSNPGNTVLALGTWHSTMIQASLTCHRSYLALGLSRFAATSSDLQVLISFFRSEQQSACSEGDSCWRHWALIRFSERCRDPCTGIRTGKPLRFGGTFRRVVHRNPSYRSCVQFWLKVNNQEPDHCSWF